MTRTKTCFEHVALVMLSLLFTRCANQSSPSSRNAMRASAAPATAPSTQYGDESYRLVNRPDEIISVLKNGSTVIARRVPSPTVAVRAYVYTGGVFEGKWLGGGLSHLLEHLVAGCSEARRTEEQNRDLLQAIGNNSNAETHYDHTVFYVNTTPE